MRTVSASLLALLLWAAPVFAQNPFMDSGSITAVSSGGACSAAPAGCAVFLLPNGVLPSITLQVSGTYSATLLFEATSDGTNWKTITGINLADGSSATGTTTTGQFSFQNSGLTGLRVRCTAFTSGTAVIAAVRGYATAKWLTPFYSSLTLSGSGSFCFSASSCIAAPSDGILNVTNNAGTSFSRLQFGGTTTSFPAIAANGNGLKAMLADGSANTSFIASDVYYSASLRNTVANGIVMSVTAPTATTFCTSPTVPSSSGTAAFTINVGTACATSIGTITLPAATTGWVVNCQNVTASASNVIGQTGGTTTTATVTNYVRTTGVAGNWTDSNILRCTAMGY